jgi:SAM-dependent methyltransferase
MHVPLKPTQAPVDESLHRAAFAEKSVIMGPMAGATWRWNPRRLGMALARYKFVSKMLAGLPIVAEIGCADGFCSEVVTREVGDLVLVDVDPAWLPYMEYRAHEALCLDIVKSPLPRRFAGIYALDVLEHISSADEPAAMANICASLTPDGVFIAGVPSLESQVYASPRSRDGHVNCKSGDQLRADAMKYFRNVFLFGQNDEMLHVGFAPMCHYLFILCTGPRNAQ